MKNTTLETCITRIETLSGQPQGTGFLVAPTLAVTCAHVVQACGAGARERRILHRRRPFPTTKGDGQSLSADLNTDAPIGKVETQRKKSTLS